MRTTLPWSSSALVKRSRAVGRAPIWVIRRLPASAAAPAWEPGANLARVEASAIFPEVLTRMKGLELARAVERTRSNQMNGIKSMSVRFTPARPTGDQS
jgi:hypothetical protein